ncbi:MAG: VIT1/CCC1 transporter family protein [Candidatus Asgardarchaeia archaeon]
MGSEEERSESFNYYVKISGVGEIARRYFIMNAFDGAVTILGVLIGAFIGGGLDPKLILTAGIGAGMAMGVSGFFGAYLAEEAERSRRVKELERSLLMDLENSVIKKAAKVAAMTAAIIDALSPMLSAIIALMPFVLSIFGILDAGIAFSLSVFLILLMLSLLGVFLGKVSKGHTLLYALVTTSAGMITGLLGILLQILFS